MKTSESPVSVISTAKGLLRCVLKAWYILSLNSSGYFLVSKNISKSLPNWGFFLTRLLNLFTISSYGFLTLPFSYTILLSASILSRDGYTSSNER